MTVTEIRVLIIEDDPHKLNDVAGCVRSAIKGAVITEAKSVGAGSKQIRVADFDLVVLDMVLPSFSSPGGGQQAQGGQQILRTIGRYAHHLPVILISQYPAVEIEDRSIETGVAKEDLTQQFGVQVVDSIHYDYQSGEWKQQLQLALDEFLDAYSNNRR